MTNNDDKELSKIQIMGERILNRILEEDSNRGAQVVNISGSQGSGKTAIMCSLCLYAVKTYPDDKIFWSSTFKTPLQCLRLPNGLLDFYVEKDKGIEFKNVESNKYVDLGQKEFTTPSTLWEQAKRGRVSCIFFADRKDLMTFIDYVREKNGWAWIFVDEFADVAPSNMGGEEFFRILNFGNVVKELRKCRKTLVWNTQVASDVDWRVKNKCTISIFCSGALRDRTTRVWQEAIDRLSKNNKCITAYLSQDGEFGLVTFKTWFNPAPDIHAVINKYVTPYYRRENEQQPA